MVTTRLVERKENADTMGEKTYFVALKCDKTAIWARRRTARPVQVTVRITETATLTSTNSRRGISFKIKVLRRT